MAFNPLPPLGVVDVCYLHQSSGEIEVVAFSKPQPTPVPPSLQEKKGIMVQGKEFPRLSIPKCSSGNTIHTNGTSLKSYGMVLVLLCTAKGCEGTPGEGGDALVGREGR